MFNSYTEDHLVEQPAIQLMQHELGWEVVNCWDEWSGGASSLGRDGKREVVLVSRLRSALQRLNPELPLEAIEGAVEGAVEEICRDRTALSLVEANREMDKLLNVPLRAFSESAKLRAMPLPSRHKVQPCSDSTERISSLRQPLTTSCHGNLRSSSPWAPPPNPQR
jgi:Type I restriction enzyme R protein N terminus (HSDR_N)